MTLAVDRVMQPFAFNFQVIGSCFDRNKLDTSGGKNYKEATSYKSYSSSFSCVVMAGVNFKVPCSTCGRIIFIRATRKALEV
jgi:hypothetical protein